jgi:hypothetical protein
LISVGTPTRIGRDDTQVARLLPRGCGSAAAAPS